MNWLLGIDCVLAASSVAIPAKGINAILPATGPWAVPVMAMFVRLVARMGSGLESVLVGLHKVQLWAEVAIDGHGITVEVPIGHVKVSILVLAWHRGSVEGVEAATIEAGQVDIPLDRSTQEVDLEKVGPAGIECLTVDHVASTAFRANEIRSVRVAGVRGDILGDLLAINGDLDRSTLVIAHR